MGHDKNSSLPLVEEVAWALVVERALMKEAPEHPGPGQPDLRQTALSKLVGIAEIQKTSLLNTSKGRIAYSPDLPYYRQAKGIPGGNVASLMDVKKVSKTPIIPYRLAHLSW